MSRRRRVWEDYSGQGRTHAQFLAEKSAFRKWSAATPDAVQDLANYARAQRSGAIRRQIARARYDRAMSFRAAGRTRYGQSYGKVRGYALSRAKRFAIARARQRALIRAGRRRLGMSRMFVSSGELKGMDTATQYDRGEVLATTNTNSGIFVLNLIEQGSGSWNRVGKKVRMKSVRINGVAKYRYSATATALNLIGNTLRCIVVYDKNPNSGSIPTFDTIFGATSQDGTETCSTMDNLRYDNTGRFRVLRDWKISAEPTATPYTTGTGGDDNSCETSYYFDEFIDLKGKPTVYSGQSDPLTIADISSGALYFIARSTYNIADSISEWAIDDAVARLRYKD